MGAGHKIASDMDKDKFAQYHISNHGNRHFTNAMQREGKEGYIYQITYL